VIKKFGFCNQRFIRLRSRLMIEKSQRVEFGVPVQGLGCLGCSGCIGCIEFRVKSLGCRVWGFELKVLGLGCRV